MAISAGRKIIQNTSHTLLHLVTGFGILCAVAPRGATDNKQQTARKQKMNDKTNFDVESDALTEKDKAIAKVLLKNKNEILRKLVEAGIHEDEESPYAYFVPTGLLFDIGDPHGYQIRSLWAIVIMARASYANAGWLDCDKEGYPELPEFCGGECGFHRVKITDPFAWQIDDAIRTYQEEMVRSGKARFVNGKFYKVA